MQPSLVKTEFTRTPTCAELFLLGRQDLPTNSSVQDFFAEYIIRLLAYTSSSNTNNSVASDWLIVSKTRKSVTVRLTKIIKAKCHIFLSKAANQFFYLLMYLFICLNVCLSCLFVCLFVRLFVYLFIIYSIIKF